jgi:pseudouridine synthase
VAKRYRLLADGRIGEQSADMLRRGVELTDGLTMPATIELGAVSAKPLTAKERLKQVGDDKHAAFQTEAYCTITEGRKRQVKRMFSYIGHPVIELERVAFGPLTLGGLPRGEWRELSADEVEALRAAVAIS